MGRQACTAIATRTRSVSSNSPAPCIALTRRNSEVIDRSAASSSVLMPFRNCSPATVSCHSAGGMASLGGDGRRNRRRSRPTLVASAGGCQVDPETDQQQCPQVIPVSLLTEKHDGCPGAEDRRDVGEDSGDVVTDPRNGEVPA